MTIESTSGKTVPSIGVLGAGPVGLGLATLLQHAGYTVVVGTRNPARPRYSSLDDGLEVGAFEPAARMDIVVLAVVHIASRPLVAGLADELAGKVVIDADNAWIPAHYAAAGLSPSITEATWMSRLLPRSKVVRAFSNIDADKLVPFAKARPGTWAAPFASDAPDAAALASDLIRATGYTPVFIGSLEDSAALDPGGILWSRMTAPGDVGPLLRRGALPISPRR